MILRSLAWILALALCSCGEVNELPLDASSADAAIFHDAGRTDANFSDASSFEPWAMVVLPDTQRYTDAFPDIFDAQTEWIANNAEDLNLKYVLHVGDVTEWSSVAEWNRAKASIATMTSEVPLAVVPGNHDYYRDRVRDSPLADYFPVADFQSMPSYGGLFEPERMDNSFHLFEVNGQQWLILALEWGPRDSALAWANTVLDNNPADHVVVLTHAYLYLDSTRYDWATRGTSQDWNPHSYPASRWPEVNDGEEIWQKLITQRSNVDFVVCGHAAREGLGRLTSTTSTGAIVHQLLANFQDGASGGAGYLRIMEFREDEIRVRTYSPWLDHFFTGPDNEFTLAWP